ncbi:MAG: hypothetical protein RIR00_2580 [Pseudomonadota bacterium]|jgi:probable phosphoglycerate mutase
MQGATSLTRICLIRHGETPWNAERRIQGQIDIGLNELGLRQADAAGRSLREAGITALYGSDLKRAWTTAERIGRLIGLDPQPLPELRERRYGLFEGLTYQDARRDQPEMYAAFERRDPDYAFPGGGESLIQLAARITRRLEALAQDHAGQNIAIVTHGGVLDIINRFVRGNPLHLPRDFLIPNAGMNWLRVEQGNWHIDSWGDTRHLEDGALDELPG